MRLRTVQDDSEISPYFSSSDFSCRHLSFYTFFISLSFFSKPILRIYKLKIINVAISEKYESSK